MVSLVKSFIALLGVCLVAVSAIPDNGTSTTGQCAKCLTDLNQATATVIASCIQETECMASMEFLRCVLKLEKYKWQMKEEHCYYLCGCELVQAITNFDYCKFVEDIPEEIDEDGTKDVKVTTSSTTASSTNTSIVTSSEAIPKEDRVATMSSSMSSSTSTPMVSSSETIPEEELTTPMSSSTSSPMPKNTTNQEQKSSTTPVKPKSMRSRSSILH